MEQGQGPVTRQELAVQVRAVREAIDAQPRAREKFAAICGGEDVLEALFDPRGVGIGRFAALMGIPATTLRHLLREELLHPFRVNGKFCFFLHNVIELRSVQQWQALGLTLVETRAFLQGQELLGLLLPQGGGVMTVSRASVCHTLDELQELKTSALVRIRAARGRLEEKHAALIRQLEQARALEEALVAAPLYAPVDSSAAPR